MTERLKPKASDVPYGLQALDLYELLSTEFPARDFLLSPIIPRGGLAMLYAQRGVGKTFLGLSIAYAVASGGKIVKWQAPGPRNVLLVDGEMPMETLQHRLAAIVQGSDSESELGSFCILAADNQEFGLPDLSTREGQDLIEPFLANVDLVILDNLSTLCRSGRENEGESWTLVQDWLLKLRRRGIAVLMIHHAGKSGSQRGTSKREDILDTVIALKRPADYIPSQGARFEIHFEKARGLSGDDAAPIDARLILENDMVKWSWQPLADAEASTVEQMLKDGMSVREIAEDTGMSKSAVGRLKKRLEEK